MVRSPRCLALTLLLALASWVGTGMATTLKLSVHAPASLAAQAREVRALAGLDLAGVEHAIGVAPESLWVQVILLEEESQIVRDLPPWVSGYAVPRNSLVVLIPERVPSYPVRTLRSLLLHEVAHLLVGRAVGTGSVPRWFDEGVATVVAREWGLEDQARYAMAAVGRGPHSLAELDDGFRGGTRDALRSYALSSAFVRFLQERCGEDVTARILARVAEGRPWPEAFTAATGYRQRELEEAFFEDDMFWNLWVPFLTSSAALWMGITLLALYAIKRRRATSRAMHEHWEREEELAEARTRSTAAPVLQRRCSDRGGDETVN